MGSSFEAGYREGLRIAAEIAASWRKPSVVRLAAGEMTAQELRTAQAVAGGIEGAIRSQMGAPTTREPSDV